MDDALTAELIRRAARDQHVRQHPIDPDRMREVDRENTAWLADVITQQGWPLCSAVGEQAALAAWLLAQHAGHDRDFQRRCLDLLAAAVDAGEASPKQLAYLTDRVRVVDGRPQLYGTQFEDGPEGLHVCPVEDEDGLDARRAAVGLGPFADYEREIRGGVVADEQNGWGGQIWAAADLITPMAVRVAATLRLADHITAGRRTTEELAAAVDADPDALGRVMNHLVSAGLLTRAGTGTYGLTAVGEQLRDEEIRPWLDLDGAIGHAELSFVQLLHTVRTGEAAFPRLYGRTFWDDLAADPGRAKSFDDLMGSRLGSDAEPIAAAYPWGELGHLVDVGGGNGALLIAILRAHGELRGTVLDRPGPVAAAERAIAAAGLEDRADTRAGSFFDPLPAGAGGYLLSGVIHDWDDEPAARILRRCAEAAGETGKVLVVEDNLAGNTEGDLRMLCYVRGRDRNPAQLGPLAASVGLEIGDVTPAGSRAIIELLTPRLHGSNTP